MLFDSWVGLLGSESYRRFVLPVTRRLVKRLHDTVNAPVIYFANGAATFLADVREVGADVIGVDWTLPLSQVVQRLGVDAVVQGNLDPAALFAQQSELEAAVRAVLAEGAAARAHVFNLGHGIHHTTDPDRVALLVDRVHEFSARGLRDE
jgi:uroporphyrinogen decarboxylase